MIDARDIELYVDRVLTTLDALTQQVARAAFALEVIAAADLDAAELDVADAPCPICRSTVAPGGEVACPACGYSREVANG